MLKVAIAGVGAFGVKHLEAAKNIPDAEIIALVGRIQEPTETATASLARMSAGAALR